MPKSFERIVYFFVFFLRGASGVHTISGAPRVAKARNTHLLSACAKCRFEKKHQASKYIQCDPLKPAKQLSAARNNSELNGPL